MNCDWVEKLERYVDAELSDADLKEVQQHLRSCPSCAADSLNRLQLKRMTQAVGRRYRPTPEFRVKIEQSIKASKDPWWAKAWVTAVTATAALLLMAGFITLWLQRPRADEQALNELADLHVSALASANPVDVVSTDRHTVKPWFEGKLPFSFDLPDLANSQFKLLGGRLAYFQQNPGAQLLFQLRKHQISVFIFQNRGGAERLSSGSWLGPELGFNNETWAAGGLRYFVIGDCGAADIHRLSELLKD